MAEGLSLLDPRKLERNPDNPRLIFRQDELDALQESIDSQGILVPLTVYKEGKIYRLLDGERRWRCALKLGLSRVPVIIQPKPDHLTNIMMMFAIHNARRDWDPLPTALKLEELEQIFKEQQGRLPTEKELAELASMSRGEVRRLRKLLALPKKYRVLLLAELEKPRSQQKITVDQVLEATKAAESLRKKEIIDSRKERSLRDSLIDKFRMGVIDNTVAPRQLVRVAQAVERGGLAIAKAEKIVDRLIDDPGYTIDHAFKSSAEEADHLHSVEQLVSRADKKLREHIKKNYNVSEGLRDALRNLARSIQRALKDE